MPNMKIQDISLNFHRLSLKPKTDRNKMPIGYTRYAFTLIEMLVVIAIISILAALLTPSLRNTILSARSIKCMSNLKQIGALVSMYADDNSGWLLTKDHFNTTSSWGWKYYLIPYIEPSMSVSLYWQTDVCYSGIFRCDEWTESWQNQLGNGAAYGGGYAWSQAVGANVADDGTKNKFHRQRISNLKNLSDTILVGDCVVSPDDALPSNSLCSYIAQPYGENWLANGYFSTTKHFGGWNNLWGDFHADSKSAGELLEGKGNEFGDSSNDPKFYSKMDYFYVPHTK